MQHELHQKGFNSTNFITQVYEIHLKIQISNHLISPVHTPNSLFVVVSKSQVVQLINI